MTPKKLNFILWGILAATALAIAGGLYFADSLLYSTAKDTAKIKADTEIAKQKIKIYTANKEKAEKLSYVEDLAAEILPVAQNQSVVVSEIFHYAAVSGVRIQALTFDEVVVAKGKKSDEQKAQEALLPKGVTVTPITVSMAEGTPYAGLEQFLHRLEDNRRKMQVNSLTAQPGETTLDVFSSVELKINLYTKAEAKSDAVKEKQ